jgi:hypothetical protein
MKVIEKKTMALVELKEGDKFLTKDGKFTFNGELPNGKINATSESGKAKPINPADIIEVLVVAQETLPIIVELVTAFKNFFKEIIGAFKKKK